MFVGFATFCQCLRDVKTLAQNSGNVVKTWELIIDIIIINEVGKCVTNRNHTEIIYTET